VARWHLEHGCCATPSRSRRTASPRTSTSSTSSSPATKWPAIDALDKGERGGPDAETLSLDTYPHVIDNS
jgi:hypothetical protein